MSNFINNKSNYLLIYIEFWIKYINYISIQYKNNLSICGFIDFIEVFYLCNANNNKIFDDFNTEKKTKLIQYLAKKQLNTFL